MFAKVLRYGYGPSDAIMLDNAEWLTKLNWIEMLRDIGRHFSVNRMLTMNSVRLRLEREQEMSFIEFNYMVCQAYDFVELARRAGCRLQMGGSDQWGNIVNGVDLGRRMGTAQLFALTTPLLTTASGAKMGKTAQGAVWLNADQFSPYDFWQYWRNVEDADVVKFLKLFTILPMSEIEKLAALQGGEINEAKKVLATEATALLHGRDAANTAAETARQTFEEGAIAENLPTVEISSGELEAGAGVLAAVRQGGPRRLERRGAPPDQGRRPARQRCRRHRREDGADAVQPDAGRRHQAFHGQEKARPAQAGVSGRIGAFVFEACGDRGNALPARMDSRTPDGERSRERRNRRARRSACWRCVLCCRCSAAASATVLRFSSSRSRRVSAGTAPQVVSVYSLTWLAGGLMAPLVGRLFDRSGPRLVYSLGLLLLGGAFLVASRAQALWQFQL